MIGKSPLVILIILAVFLSGCIQETGPEIRALKSLEAVSDIKYPSILNGGTMQFKFETPVVIEPDMYFRLVLPEGVEYVDGDFQLMHDGNELFLEPTGAKGYNASGEYLGKDAEARIMKLDKTEYYFTLKGVAEGKHLIVLYTNEKENGAKTNKFVELRSTYFCSADTLEKAVQICTQVEAQCTTRECVLEQTRQEATKVD